MTTSQRAQLINDAFAMATSGLTDASVPLDIVSYLAQEKEYAPLNIFFNRVQFYTNYLESSSFSQELSDYFSRIIAPTYDRIGWFELPSDKWLEKYLSFSLLIFSFQLNFYWFPLYLNSLLRFVRPNVINFACKHNLQSCVAKSREYFDEFKLTLSPSKYK